MEWLSALIPAVASVLVALLGIIPTIIGNRKKTQKTIEETTQAMERNVQKVQTTLDNHIKEDEDERARNQRYRILRFYDEMCQHQKHSESHFEDILDDIDNYEKYCDTHPDFRNNRGRVAMHYIKEEYGRIKSSGGFLTHEEEEVQS